MKNKAILLDRDGVINADLGKRFEKLGGTYRLEDLEFILCVFEGLRILQGAGYKLIIVTNQGKIARGYCTKQEYFTFRNEMHKQLREQGVLITAEYFCPHHPDSNCGCRKPKTGMLEQATRDFNLDLKECWMIGDREIDILAGKSAGCRTIHVLTGEYKRPISYADFTALNLIEAANYILDRNKNK